MDSMIIKGRLLYQSAVVTTFCSSAILASLRWVAVNTAGVTGRVRGLSKLSGFRKLGIFFRVSFN